MLTALDPQAEAAKNRLSGGIGKIHLLKGDAAAPPQQLTRARAVDHVVVLADHLDRIGNSRDKLGSVDRRKCEIARAVQDAKGYRHSQNYVAGADPSTAP